MYWNTSVIFVTKHHVLLKYILNYFAIFHSIVNVGALK